MMFSIPILAYHSVSDRGPPDLAPYRVSPSKFRDQMRFLRENNFYSVLLDDWASCLAAKRPLSGRPIVITFDDGYKDFIDAASPILAEYNFRATTFVVTECVGNAADWDNVADPIALMDWDDLRVVQRQGNAVGTHSRKHQRLTELPDTVLLDDCTQARETVRRQLGREVYSMAYPWGESDARVRRIVSEAGYKAAVGLSNSLSNYDDDPMVLPRIEIFGADDIDAFALKVDADGHEREPVRRAISSRVPNTTPRHPDPDRPNVSIASVLSRIGAAIAELETTRADLAHLLPEPVTNDGSGPAHAKLAALFGLSKLETGTRLLVPYEEVSPGIRLGFSPEATLQVRISPKNDQSISPAYCLNTIGFKFNGCGWFSIELKLDTAEIRGASAYQFALSAGVTAPLSGQLILRQFAHGAHHDIFLQSIRVRPDERSYTFSGTFLSHDQDAESTVFILVFRTDQDTDLEIYYSNLYFT